MSEQHSEDYINGNNELLVVNEQFCAWLDELGETEEISVVMKTLAGPNAGRLLRTALGTRSFIYENGMGGEDANVWRIEFKDQVFHIVADDTCATFEASLPEDGDIAEVDETTLQTFKDFYSLLLGSCKTSRNLFVEQARKDNPKP